MRQQLRAILLHRIAVGELAPGAPLPSVRDMAEAAGVAPMTVSKVYAELKAAGQVEARVGSGTFVAASSLTRIARRDEIEAILTQMDALVDRASRAGLSPADVVATLTARAIRRVGEVRGSDVVMVGLFDAATASYAERIAEQVGDAARVTPWVLSADDPARDAARLGAADLIVTFAGLHDRIAGIVPGAPIVDLRFIPAEETRMALASVDPLARVAVVSRFADFLPVLEMGVRRFAPHLSDVAVMDMAAREMEPVVARADVVIMSTGAEVAGDLAPAGATRIEYRHIPDPGDVARLVVARIAGDAPPDRDRKEAS